MLYQCFFLQNLFVYSSCRTLTIFIIKSFEETSDFSGLNFDLSQSSNKKERITKVPNSKQEDGRFTEECNNIGRSKIAQKQSAWNELNLGITVTPIFPTESGDRVAIQGSISDEIVTDNERLLKSIDNLYPLGSELKEIADIMSRVRNRRDKYMLDQS